MAQKRRRGVGAGTSGSSVRELRRFTQRNRHPDTAAGQSQR